MYEAVRILGAAILLLAPVAREMPKLPLEKMEFWVIVFPEPELTVTPLLLLPLKLLKAMTLPAPVALPPMVLLEPLITTPVPWPVGPSILKAELGISTNLVPPVGSHCASIVAPPPPLYHSTSMVCRPGVKFARPVRCVVPWKKLLLTTSLPSIYSMLPSSLAVAKLMGTGVVPVPGIMI